MPKPAKRKHDWKNAPAVRTQNPAVGEFLGSLVELANLHAKRGMLRERSRIPGTF